MSDEPKKFSSVVAKVSPEVASNFRTACATVGRRLGDVLSEFISNYPSTVQAQVKKKLRADLAALQARLDEMENPPVDCEFDDPVDDDDDDLD